MDTTCQKNNYEDTLTYSYKVDAETECEFTMRAFRVVNGKKVYSDYTERIHNYKALDLIDVGFSEIKGK